MRAAAVAACLALALPVAGCGGGNDETQIRSLISAMRQAQDSGNAEKACKDVYVVQEPGGEGGGEAEKEREKDADAAGTEGGPGCELAFEQSVARRRAQVKDLRTRLTRVQVDGEQGTAVLRTTLTRPDGSTLERDVEYPVVHTEEGWRVRISPE